MDIKIDEHAGRVPVTVFHITGNIDSNTHQDVDAQVTAAIAAGAQHILIDLKRVDYMSSAGLHLMHSVFNQLRERYPDTSEAEMRAGINAGTYKSGHLKLARPTANVRKVLEMGGFDMFLEIHSDLESAVASF
jgi:anti-anti-sigma factor